MNQYEKYLMGQQTALMKFLEEKSFEATNEREFTAGMLKLGLDPDDVTTITHVHGDGYIRNEDVDEYLELLKGPVDQLEKLLDADTTGEGFIHDMFVTELMNSPLFVTEGNVDAALEAMGFSRKVLEQDPRMKRGLELALKDVEKKSDLSIEDIVAGRLS